MNVPSREIGDLPSSPPDIPSSESLTHRGRSQSGLQFPISPEKTYSPLRTGFFNEFSQPNLKGKQIFIDRKIQPVKELSSGDLPEVTKEKTQETPAQRLKNKGFPFDESKIKAVLKQAESLSKYLAGQKEGISYPVVYKATIKYDPIVYEAHAPDQIIVHFSGLTINCPAKKIPGGSGSYKEFYNAWTIIPVIKRFAYGILKKDTADEAEINTCTILNENPHRNLIKVFKFFEFDNLQKVMITKWFPQNLANFLGQLEEKEITISDQDKIKYALDLARGIAHLHQLKIAHRDINPRNILVGRNRLVITDFGLSCNEDDIEKKMHPVGTQEYYPYEFLVGKFKGNILAADIWSLGCVFWELFSGREFPWKKNLAKGGGDIEGAKKKIKAFKEKGRFTNPVLQLIWNMLRLKPSKRICIKDVENVLEKISKILPEENRFSYAKAFESLYEEKRALRKRSSSAKLQMMFPLRKINE